MFKFLGRRLQLPSQFGADLVLTTITNIFIAALGFCTGVILARQLGPTGRGDLAIIQTIPTIIAHISMLGTAEALTYFSARQPGSAGRWLVTSILIISVAALPAWVLGTYAIPHFLAAQTPAVIKYTQWYLLVIPLYGLTNLLVAPLRGINDLITWNVLRSLTTVGWLIVVVAVILLGQVNAPSLAQAYLISMLVVTLISFPVVFKRLPGSFSPSLSLVNPLLRFGVPTVISRVPSILNTRLDQMLMAFYLPPRMLGLYVAAVAWSRVTSPLIGALSQTILPRVASDQRGSSQIQRVVQGSRLAVIISLLTAALTAFLAPLLVPLVFGSSYKDAIFAAILLSIASGADSYRQVLVSISLGLGAPKYVLISEMVGLGVTLLLLQMLLQPYEIIGAAAASLAAYIVVCICLVVLVTRKCHIPATEMLLPAADDWRLVQLQIAKFRQRMAHNGG